MKTSILLFLTDILPSKKRFFNKIVKNKMFDDSSAVKIFDQLKSSGVDGIEILLPSFVTIDDIQEVKKLVDANNIKILSVHQALRFLTITRLKEVKDLLEIARIFSAKVVVLHMNSAGKQIFDKKYLAAIHAMQEEYGIKIGFENREKYLGSMLNGYGWDEKKFGNLMRKEDLNITFDVCHMGQAGGDIINFFKNNKERIVNIHISDYRSHALNSSLRPIRYKHLPLGKGSLPIQAFLETLKKENYQGLLTLEINADFDELISSAKIITNAT
jgi:sugar phosphate isomerase/epimerase